MTRTCTVCRDPQREEIDKALVAGTPYRDIARRFRLSKAALSRHRRHVAEALAEARLLTIERLVADLDDLQHHAEQQLARAEVEHDLRGALLAIRECRGIIESGMRLLEVGDLAQRVKRLEERLTERRW